MVITTGSRMQLSLAILAGLVTAQATPAQVSRLIAEKYDYAPAMRKVAAQFKGREGVVLHLGDSITYANPYSQWARGGKGKTAGDAAVCRWMHVGARDETDGWFLCSVDRPGGRSDTAASGIRINEFLAGGRPGMLALDGMLKKYQPRMVVLMLGTNDASAGRKTEDYLKDMTMAIDAILAAHVIPILSTIPPHPGRLELAAAYNTGLRQLAKDKQIPLIDYEAEILRRRPKDWNGTLLGKNDVHPTANHEGATASSEPTEENLRNSGYLLRGWLSVQKIAEVKDRVLGPG
jgi:lysophospholipase L1-like esterase